MRTGPTASPEHDDEINPQGADSGRGVAEAVELPDPTGASKEHGCVAEVDMRDADAAEPSSPPGSPAPDGAAAPAAEREHRAFLDLPPELAAPDEPCDPAVQQRVARWLALQAQGRHLTSELRRSRDYRNPEFFRKMVEYWEIEEHGTLFGPGVFDPAALPAADTLPSLQKEWAEEEERRRAVRAAGTGRIEFTKEAPAHSALATSAIAAAHARATALAAAAGMRK